MGYIRHDAIVVTSWEEDKILLAYDKANELFLHPSSVTKEGVNSYRSFLIPPDGSKEGWEASDVADKKRQLFIEYLNGIKTYIEWVHVSYGNDDSNAKIMNHAWKYLEKSDELPFIL